MATNYKSLKCDCCAGALEYSKEKKVWICQYCGNEIRREEEYDGLYTIKNVVKQTIVDVAYGRLDVAQKNLAECEKMDSKYVGTLIARLAVQMFTLTTPGACPQGAMKSMIAQLKRGYEDLKAIDAAISTEEEALYESFEENSDTLAVLVLVFDSLGDSVHRDFVEELMIPAKIYASAINDSLLRYATKNNKSELIDQILENADNLNCKTALMVLLAEYPDGDKKIAHIERIFPNARLAPDDRKLIEKYIKESLDQIDTKVSVYKNAVGANLFISIECVAEHILEKVQENEASVKTILQMICKSKPNDTELYYLVERIFTKHSAWMMEIELQTLAEEKVYLALTAKHLLGILKRSEFAAEARVKILDLVHNWKIDARTHDMILDEYLNRTIEKPEDREVIISKLLSYVNTISTAALTQYVINGTVDGTKKVDILEKILSLDLNLSFFRELLQRYMNESKDDIDTKNKVVGLLSDKGLQVDGGALVEMAVAATDENTEAVVEFVQKMLQSGVRLRNDALNTYLTKRKNFEYYAIFIKLFYNDASIISSQAMNNYVLHSKMEESMKYQNILTFIEHCTTPFGTGECTVRHLGHVIKCNLLQGYVLTSKESEYVTTQLVEKMKGAQAKLNPTIQVDGMPMKFKKYIVDNRSQLSELTEKICTDNKVFSFLF